ncbi:hypothetical protein ACWF76_25150 [Streptomyces globisporus]
MTVQQQPRAASDQAMWESVLGPHTFVGRLESAGCAYKDTCDDDRRGVYAVTTDEGRKHYQDARSTYADVLGSALETAGADDQLARAVQALRGTA